MTGLRVGAVFKPQATTIELLRETWVEADTMGVDSLWVTDHFFPLFVDAVGIDGHPALVLGDKDAEIFEGWTLLSAMAADTKMAMVGVMVTCNSYRNPDLLAHMAMTLNHLSGGRLYLGVGSGWFERDYKEYGYEFGTAGSRLRQLEADIPRIKKRLENLNPPIVGKLPLLIGGEGEKVTLRLVAQYADAWNAVTPPENYKRLVEVLNEWCKKVDRDPAEIERTVCIGAGEVGLVDRYVDAGADHVMVFLNSPFGLDPLGSLISYRDSLR